MFHSLQDHNQGVCIYPVVAYKTTPKTVVNICALISNTPCGRSEI